MPLPIFSFIIPKNHRNVNNQIAYLEVFSLNMYAKSSKHIFHFLISLIFDLVPYTSAYIISITHCMIYIIIYTKAAQELHQYTRAANLKLSLFTLLFSFIFLFSERNKSMTYKFLIKCFHSHILIVKTT